MEIAPQVHSVPAPTPAAFMGFAAPNVYLVTGDRVAFVDAGYDDEAAVRARLDYAAGLGLPLAYVIVTHPHIDHIGGAERIKGATGAQIVAHPLSAPGASQFFRATSVDLLVEEGHRLDLGGIELLIIHAPGHHPGHICIYMEKGGILFSGDNVLGLGTTAINPLSGDMAQYINTLEKLLGYDIKMICSGHGPLIGDPRRKLQELLQHRREREEQVLGCLRRGKVTVGQMVAQIYPELDSRLLPAAHGQVQAHLIKLKREGRVLVVSRQGQDIYALR